MKNIICDFLIFYAGFMIATLMYALFHKPDGFPHADDME